MSLTVSRQTSNRIARLVSLFESSIPCITRRHESSARRTTKRLRTKPDPSFTSSIPASQLNDHIVFNPPSSVPSPYETPPAFLPPNDPRRKLLAQAHAHASPYNQSDRHLPPVIPNHKPYEKKYHLREVDFERMRRLREEDPFKWTRSALAEEFECSLFFVGIVCQSSRQKLVQDREQLEQVKAGWGRRKRNAREDRGRRREQ